ncbi:MAG: efflux RND transporter periplasmic adaptor subunit [Planctomycetaceae bacterium]|nr:efflux RND transporter periplasmic adaptor subunit [Planctomycetaceae bacterium]
MKIFKKVMTLLVVAMLTAGGFYFYGQQVQAKEQAKVQVADNTARATRGDIDIRVSATGRIEPEREVEIKSKASGEVIKVFADVSDQVKQGEMLFKLDPTDEERSVAKLQAALAMSKAKLEQTRLAVQAAEAKLVADTARAQADLKSAEAERDEYTARLNRSLQLYEQKVISREEHDTAVTKGVQTQAALENARIKIDDLKVQALELERTRQEITIADAQVDNDTVALEDALQRLRDTEVFSPIDGVVSERTVQEGLIVASGVSNVGGGTTTMRVIDLSRIYAIAAVDEADISGVQPGVRAVVTADAYKDMQFTGKVVRIAATGVVESNVVTFDVKVEVDSDQKHLLKPEMTTNVTFLVDSRKDVVTVPAGAVVRKAVTETRHQPAALQAGEDTASVDYSRRQSYVTVVKPDGTEEERAVTVGLSDSLRTEIIDGLQEGEEVLIRDAGASKWSGQNNRRPGMRL